MHNFVSHPFFQQLLSLNLPRDDFVVSGSGPLYARGLISILNDVDVVARGKAWEIAVRHGGPKPAPYSGVQAVELFNKNVEILDGWFPEIWDVNDLIDGADLIDGIRFARMDVVRRTKEQMARPQDIQHLKIIDEYLSRGSMDV